MTREALRFENAGAVVNAIDERRLLKKLLGVDYPAVSGTGNGGVMRDGDLAVTQRGAGANLSVDIAAGAGYVEGTVVADQGGYFLFNDATFNVAVAAGDATNPRIDIVGIRVRDTAHGGAADDGELVVVQGTPAGAPAEPALPANFVSLARLDVPAGAASIVTGYITDRRRKVGALGGILRCTSSTRPASPWEGMTIYETDTDKSYQYSGSAWVQIALLGAFDSAAATLAGSTSGPTWGTGSSRTITSRKNGRDYSARLSVSAGTPGFVAPVGNWAWTLPFTSAVVGFVGLAWFADVSAPANYYGLVFVSGTTVNVYVPANPFTTLWGAASPVVPANNDAMYWNMHGIETTA